jgi:hypothetical protein
LLFLLVDTLFPSPAEIMANLLQKVILEQYEKFTVLGVKIASLLNIFWIVLIPFNVLFLKDIVEMDSKKCELTSYRLPGA